MREADDLLALGESRTEDDTARWDALVDDVHAHLREWRDDLRGDATLEFEGKMVQLLAREVKAYQEMLNAGPRPQH